MFPRREIIFASFAVVTLLPAVAYACDGMAHLWLYVPVVPAIILTWLTAIVVATVSSFIEGYRDVQIDKPSWWKTRMSLIGIGGLIAASLLPIAAIFALEAMGIYRLPFDAFPMVMTFIITAPLVCQTAYAARTWQKSDVVAEER